MTDNEIIKALECCGTLNGCKFCPLSYKGEPTHNMQCAEECLKNALDLINRQQAEIETLTARIGIYKTCNARKDEAIHNLESEIERLKNSGICANSVDDWLSFCKKLKAEAIKEFAEMLKRISRLSAAVVDGREIHKIIDNLVQEMAGDPQ